MKYVAIIDTDDYENFEFFEDATGKYLAVKDVNAKDNEWMALQFKEAPSQSVLEFEDRKQQRQTVETMNGLLANFRNYVDEDTSKAIDTTLYILSHIPVKGGEVE